jgi:hypothetical protein
VNALPISTGSFEIRRRQAAFASRANWPHPSSPPAVHRIAAAAIAFIITRVHGRQVNGAVFDGGLRRLFEGRDAL